MDSDSNASDEVTISSRSESPQDLLPEFEYFGRLPTEIRLNIWNQVCLEPRVIDLWAVPTVEGSDPATKPFYYATHSLVPSILSVSKEARKVSLEHYTLEFDTDFRDIIGTSHWHRYLHSFGGEYGKCQCQHWRRATISTTSEPHIYVNLNCDIICPMPLEAPLGYTGRNDVASYESGPIMLDDFIRENETKIYHIAFEAKEAVHKGGQYLWRFLLPSRETPRRYNPLKTIIVLRTPESRWKSRYRAGLAIGFDPEDPISLEVVDPEDDTVEEEVKTARELEFQQALEEIKKSYGPDEKLPIVKHMILKIYDVDPFP